MMQPSARSTGAFTCNPYVGIREIMAALTVRLDYVHGWRRTSTKHVATISDRLEMLRIDARSVTTHMIHDQSVRDSTNPVKIGDSMCIDASIAERKFAVASATQRRYPPPARRKWNPLDIGLEPSKFRVCHRSAPSEQLSSCPTCAMRVRRREHSTQRGSLPTHGENTGAAAGLAVPSVAAAPDTAPSGV